MEGAEQVKAPREGQISVLAVTTSASAEQDLGDHRGFARFISDVDCYITFGEASVTNPDQTAVSGGGRTWLLPAKTPMDLWIERSARKFKVKGTAAGHLRWYLG